MDFTFHANGEKWKHIHGKFTKILVAPITIIRIFDILRNSKYCTCLEFPICVSYMLKDDFSLKGSFFHADRQLNSWTHIKVFKIINSECREQEKMRRCAKSMTFLDSLKYCVDDIKTKFSDIGCRKCGSNYLLQIFLWKKPVGMIPRIVTKSSVASLRFGVLKTCALPFWIDLSYVI